MKNRYYCLAIETAGPRMGLALYDYARYPVLKKMSTHLSAEGDSQSESLIPQLKKMLAKNRINKKDIGLFAVDIGPGSFTGVRVGVSTARMLAQGLQVPLIGISSLEAMAWSFMKKNTARLVVSCIPALAGEVYFAAYNRLKNNHNVGLRSQVKPCWKTNVELKKFLLNKKNGSVVVQSWTDELNQYRALCSNLMWYPGLIQPEAWAIAELAINQLIKNKKSSFSYEKVVPHYLQPSWAERNKSIRGK